MPVHIMPICCYCKRMPTPKPLVATKLWKQLYHWLRRNLEQKKKLLTSNSMHPGRLWFRSSRLGFFSESSRERGLVSRRQRVQRAQLRCSNGKFSSVGILTRLLL
eukprot:6192743-Pleurochrysis_carterae.AAC.1